MYYGPYKLREKSPYSELLWSAFSRISTEYGEMLHISSHLVQMRENEDQNNSECKHFLLIVFSLNNLFRKSSPSDFNHCVKYFNFT